MTDSEVDSDPSSSVEFDYTVRAGCANYSPGFDEPNTGIRWFGRWEGQPSRIRAAIVDVFGNQQQEFHSNGQAHFNTNSNMRPTYPVQQHQDDRKELIEEAAEVGNLVLISCEHTANDGNQQVFKALVPIAGNPSFNAVYEDSHHLNFGRGASTFFMEVNLVDDLVYRIYRRLVGNGVTASSAWLQANEFISAQFPKAVYGSLDIRDYTGLHSLSEIRAAGSQQVNHYLRLKFLADDISSGRIDVLNELVAQEYENVTLRGASCGNKHICAAFGLGAFSSVTANPDYANTSLEGWTVQKVISDPDDASGSFNVAAFDLDPTRYQLQLDFIQHEARAQEDTSYVSVNQAYELADGEEVVNLFLRFESDLLDGDCESFGGCFSSGYATVYFCYQDSNRENIGCVGFIDYNDSVTVPTRVGNYFNPDNLENILLIEAPDFLFSRTVSLSQLAQRLPYVDGNRHLVEYIEFGAEVGELRNTSDDFCANCTAEAVVRRVELTTVY